MKSVGTISFSLETIHFRYDLATEFLQRLGGGGKNLSNGKAPRILGMLISATPSVVSKETIYSKLGIATDGALQQQIQSVRKLLTTLADEPNFDAKKFIRPSYGEGYTLDATDLDFQTLDAPVTPEIELDMEGISAERQAQDNIQLLISDLLKLYPNELSDFFARSSSGIPLPFFILDVPEFGRPKFPIEITEESLPGPNRGEKSLVEMRKALGKEIYNGQIYRLHSARPDDWMIGRTRYTQVVDDCDFLKSSIFTGWGRLCEHPLDKRLDYLRKSEVVREWLERIQKIKAGDFSHYSAGIGFNTPIFREVPNGTLELLYARGSLSKQAEGGRLHVCPAGMLEYGRGAVKATELTKIDFGTYALKEMIEETLRHDAFKENDRTDFLDKSDGAGDFLNAEALRSYCKDILKGLEQQIDVGQMTILLDDGTEADLSLAAAFEVENIHKDLNDRQMYVVLDAFVLRPEIIVPIYVSEKIDVLVSWENDSAHRHVFHTAHDAEALVGSMSEWTAPGLAAAYLVSRNWFVGRNSDDGRQS